MLLWRRGLASQFPGFLRLYASSQSVEEFAVYAAWTLSPSISARTVGSIFCAGLIVEGALRLGVVREIVFSFDRRSFVQAIGKGRADWQSLAASVRFSCCLPWWPRPTRQIDHPQCFGFPRPHPAEQAIYIIEVRAGAILVPVSLRIIGLLGERDSFGVDLGLGVIRFVTTWRLVQSSPMVGWPYSRIPSRFLNMATYHVCVLIWLYYLLVPSEECHDVCGFVAGE